MHIIGEDNEQKVRYALICVVSDMPASRKVCGILGHTAKMGCKNEFSGGISYKDYVG